jgi:hydroxyacylglutathione hydrolase
MEMTPMIGTEEVKQRLAGANNWTLLDVRAADERSESAIEGSQHIYIGHLNERWCELDKHRRYTLMCASGIRATVAAGWLAGKGFDKVDIYLGSMGAWKAAQE